MHLTPCQTTRTVNVAGIARDARTGNPIPFRKPLEERCLLPEHTGPHMWPTAGGYSIGEEDTE